MALLAAGGAVVGVVLVVVGVVAAFVVVPVVAPAVVVVLPAAVVVVVLEGAVVVVVELRFSVVVVVWLDDFLDELALGELDPHAAAISPPARTKVPTSHRRPVRRDTGTVSSGVTRVNTYCSSPRCGANAAVFEARPFRRHSYRANLNGTRRIGKLLVSRG